MRFLKTLRGVGLAWLLLLVVILGTPMVMVHAATDYGRENYGSCTYGPCSKHTVAQTPSGLKIAVNLTDGQTIPADGYTISLTPLNGSGSSFTQAEIFIDGVKVATITPGEDGSASWHWDPRIYPGSNIQILVTDIAGTVTTFNFKVKLGAVDTPIAQFTDGAGGGPTAQENKQFFIGRLFSEVTEKAKRVIKQLPAPVVYTFPYMLFSLVLVEMVILLLQTKRELRELATATERAEAERNVAKMKQTLMELVSHYLRTPLTILQGGAEGLVRDGVEAATITSLQTVIKQLHETIEALITKTTAQGAVIPNEQQPSVSPKRHFVLMAGRIAIWLPVALVGILAFCFVYLANEVSRFTTNTIGILTQVLVYSILILALYQVLRRWQLHRRDAAAAQKLLVAEQAVQTLRDSIITQSASQLESQVSALGTIVQGLPTTALNVKFVSRGHAQLSAVTNKFVIASHLRGARSHDVYSPSSLQSLYEPLRGALAQPVTDKEVTITLITDASLEVQNVALLSLVLQTVLDNAVGYSGQKGSIELAATATVEKAQIDITDHGSGIDASKQAALFQPFFKAEGAEEFNREGMGFSLYLDKLIMAYLGGTIELVSQPGTFTKVTLAWPITKA